MKRFTFLTAFFILFFCFPMVGQTNGFKLVNNSGSDKIPFQLINNLIIIPIEINNVELSFILDTGVSKPILFNIQGDNNVINVKEQSSIALKGLGDGLQVEAFKSKNNKIKIGDAYNLNQTIYAIYNSGLDYSSKLGISIHGIIGYDLFKDFVVEINYKSRYIKLIDHDRYKTRQCKKCEMVDLTLLRGKPHISAKVAIDGEQIPINVLLDTGSSDALWLFEDASQDIVSSDNYIDDFLGYGLSGSLYGKRSRVNSLSIDQFVLNKSLVAFPEGASIDALRKNKNRNGTIGGEILRRFNLIFNYKNNTLILRKNNNFKSDFAYNKSGIDLEYKGFRVVKDYYYNLKDGRLTIGEDVTKFVNNSAENKGYRYKVKPAFSIVKLRDSSPAKRAGLQLGDIILKINNHDVKNYTLQEVVESLNGKTGKQMKVEVERNNRIYEFTFKLLDVI